MKKLILPIIFIMGVLFLGACSFLPKVNTTVSVVGDGYRVILPESYSNDNGQKYPVVYVLPDDGMTVTDTSFADQLGRTMSSGDSMDMIIVAMDLKNMGITFVEDPYDYADSLIREIDERYRTVPDAKWRMIAGRGDAGALAEVFAFFARGEKLLKEPKLFGAAASLDPEYHDENFVWDESYHDRLELIRESSDKITEGSTIKRFLYRSDEESISFSRAYYYEKAAIMMLGGFSDSILNDYISGSLVLSKRVLSPEAVDPHAEYEIRLGKGFADIAPEDYKISAGISVVEDTSGTELEWTNLGSLNAEDGNSEMYSKEPVEISNAFEGDSASVKLVVNVMGMEYTVAESSLIHIMIPDIDEHFVDLMGDWYYANISKAESKRIPDSFTDFDTITPAIGRTKGGYSWYARSFMIPEDYPREDYVLELGCIDEADICYINGNIVGSCGFNEQKIRPVSNESEKDRHYTLPYYYLNFGGENTICILTYSSSEKGGWYTGHPVIGPASENISENESGALGSHAEAEEEE